MRIINWNTNYWQRKHLDKIFWDYLDNKLQPDIAIFQEVCPNLKSPGFIGDRQKEIDKFSEANTFVWEDIDSKRKWGSGIFTNNIPIRELKIKTDYRGCLSVAEIKIDNKILTVISLYAIIENGYSITSLHRMFSDLTLLLEGKLGQKRNIILGGDFNASLQWDKQQTGVSHKIMFERLENFGLMNLLKIKYNEPIETWRSNNANRKWQLDYVFVSSNLIDQIKDIKVLYNDRIAELSDHNPIEIRLDWKN
ncbi:MAG: endonuclease/exonuclease/phosphatase family protein [Candidatus Marinimicrobia bacterium]|nr:endonuclease/exonuclease/phosphatase family protein [Candidatus Neomarinimicrobiota bacterium]